MTLFEQLILVVRDTKAWVNNIKPGILAWAIKEQGAGRKMSTGGMGELARNAHNYFSLHQRPEMIVDYPRTYHLIQTKEKDNNYVVFFSPEQCLVGLVKFLHRDPYQVRGPIDDHMTNIKDLLLHILPAFCPEVGYVESVLSFIPEAEAELRKVGWKPDEEEPMPEPLPVSEYTVVAGTLNGPNVHYFPVKNYDHYYRSRTDAILLHGTGNLEGTSNLQCTKCGLYAPGILASREWNDPKCPKESKRSAPLLILPDGSTWQTMDLRLVGYHCRGHNPTTMGIELVNFGPCEKWQEILGWFFRFKNKPWEQKIRKSDMVLIGNKYYQNYTDAQYNTLNAILPPTQEFLKAKFISGHSNYASAWDPGPTFDWRRIGG